MAHSLYFNDGSAEFIMYGEDTPEFYDDFQKIIYEKLGRDAENIVIELRKKADYTSQKVNTDLTAYEAELSSNATAFMDIMDVCDTISAYISECKRINKQVLVKHIDEIKNLINNQI